MEKDGGSNGRIVEDGGVTWKESKGREEGKDKDLNQLKQRRRERDENRKKKTLPELGGRGAKSLEVMGGEGSYRRLVVAEVVASSCGEVVGLVGFSK